MRERRARATKLTLIGPGGIEAIRRPGPPDELSVVEAKEWKAVVNRMPPEWFPRETHAMLVQYCRMKARADQIAKLMNSDSKKLPVRQFQSLLRTEQALSDTISRLASRMRISQQSQYDQRKRRDYSPKLTPWARDKEDNEETEADEGREEHFMD